MGLARSILFVVNSPSFFLSHRLPVALAARRQGYEVHVATPCGPGVAEIAAAGLVHHTLPLTRSGSNPVREVSTLVSLWRLMRGIRPSIVHLVTIKPVLYGGLMARLARLPGVVVAISGLGAVFVPRDEKGGWLRWFVTSLYRVSLGHPNSVVIFQNHDDRDVLAAMGAIRNDQPRLIRGSGVALDAYPMWPEPAEGPPVVTMAARLLLDKGVEEFVEAARILAARGVSAEFRLIGEPDPGNPASVAARQLDEWRSIPNLRVLGFRQDIAEQYARSHIITLPSYYGEGLPKSLVEAAACGRAVVTTDRPGCRDAIEPGKSGLLVPVRDVTALADAIQYLIEHPEKRRAMGQAGRKLAEREFAIEKIVAQHLAIYADLENRCAR
jgi:glycosyltransferase involved in cell wall biosynthesis